MNLTVKAEISSNEVVAESIKKEMWELTGKASTKIGSF